jgi:hypothetical protein
MTATQPSRASYAFALDFCTSSTPTLNAGTGAESYPGDITKGVFAWGAQLEQSSTAGEYIPTTSAINSAPRFDHNPTTGESLGLLVEEQRTNLVVRSEEFDNAFWGKNASNVSVNTIASPNGATTADSFLESATTDFHSIYAAPAMLANTGYVFSIYAKANGRDWLVMNIFTGAASPRTWFNVATGTVGTVGSGAVASISAAGNGWYRCSIAVTTASSGGPNIAIWTATADNNFFHAGDITKGFFIWGAQLEAGAFPTSYIPTTSATVTRAADVASITGTAFSSWYNQTEGTVFADVTARPDGLVCNFDDGSFNNRKPQIAIGAGAACDVAYVAAGSVVASFSQASTSNQRNLIATAYATDNYGFTANGATPAQDSLGAIPSTVTTLRFGRFHNGSLPLYGTIKRLTYYPVRLPNATLQAITAS